MLVPSYPVPLPLCASPLYSPPPSLGPLIAAWHDLSCPLRPLALCTPCLLTTATAAAALRRRQCSGPRGGAPQGWGGWGWVGQGRTSAVARSAGRADAPVLPAWQPGACTRATDTSLAVASQCLPERTTSRDWLQCQAPSYSGVGHPARCLLLAAVAAATPAHYPPRGGGKRASASVSPETPTEPWGFTPLSQKGRPFLTQSKAPLPSGNRKFSPRAAIFTP